LSLPTLFSSCLLQVFKYDGTLLAREKRDVLYEASWVAMPPGTFEDRPQSPRAAGAAAAANGSGGSGEAPTAAALPAQPVRAAAYVPVHMRGKPGAAAAAAATFSLARDAADKGGRIPTGALAARPAGPTSNLPPGAAPPPSKSASKNAKRRAKKAAGGGDA
jgi:hypothetical protein